MDELAFRLDRSLEVSVRDGTSRDEVHRTAEQASQRILECAAVPVAVPILVRLELHQEVHVAAHRIEVIADRCPEHVEPPDPEGPAYIGDLGPVPEEHVSWTEANRVVGVVAVASSPCSDCTLGLALEMSAEGRCIGRPGRQAPRARQTAADAR
jgi:hypothetical protein